VGDTCELGRRWGVKANLVFDQRNHATEGLYRPGLADTQGPALMAYNDAIFSEKDWEAFKFDS